MKHLRYFNESIEYKVEPISKKVGEFDVEISKTENSYKISVKYQGKVIGRLYLMNFKSKSDGIWAEARRFYINPEFRNKNVDKLIINTLKKHFKNLNILAYPSPNRFTGMTDDNKEEFRKKLTRLYSMYGMKKVGDKSSRMEIRTNEMLEDKFDYDVIIKIMKGTYHWGFGVISYIDDFEANPEYFLNPEDNNDYANQFHIYLSDMETGQLRGTFQNKHKLNLGKWRLGTQVANPVSIYSKVT